MTVYAEAVSDVLSYAAGSAAGEAISRLVSGSEAPETAGVVERAELADEQAGRIRFAVAGIVALVLAMSLFRGR
jgi:hypothetical protein